MQYIKQSGVVFVLESEKAVMQLWDYGYKNAVSTGGKELSSISNRIARETRSRYLFSMDKDVDINEIDLISADSFLMNYQFIIYMTNEDILDDKESPSDNPNKWETFNIKNLYRLR